MAWRSFGRNIKPVWQPHRPTVEQKVSWAWLHVFVCHLISHFEGEVVSYFIQWKDLSSDRFLPCYNCYPSWCCNIMPLRKWIFLSSLWCVFKYLIFNHSFVFWMFARNWETWHYVWLLSQSVYDFLSFSHSEDHRNVSRHALIICGVLRCTQNSSSLTVYDSFYEVSAFIQMPQFYFNLFINETFKI